MRRILSVALVLAGAFLFAPAASAQFTTVTATVKDPNGIPYAGAVMNAVLVPSVGGGYTLGGQPYSGRIGPVTLSSSGSFTVNFGDVTQISPGSPQWQITIDSAAATIAPPLGTGPQSFTYTSTGTTISGSSPVSLTTALNALAPALTNITLGSGSVTSVSCGNLTNVFNCSVATATTTPALSFAAVTSGPVLDCSVQPGADMGAQLNACIAALPASGGIADATKFTSPQTISTAVVDNKAAVIQTCGIAITQTANISLTNTRAALHGCPDQSTVITKGANIDQITMTAAYNSVDFVTLVGVSGSFTGNGINENGASFGYVANNTISGEANDGILLSGSTIYGQIIGNDLSGYVSHAIQQTGVAGFEVWINHNKMDDTATATGSAVELVTTVLLTENDITNAHGFLAVHNTSVTSNASVYSGNYLQSIGTGGSVISVAGSDYIHHNTMFNVGAHAVIIGGGSITDNNLQPTTAGADVIDAPSLQRPIIQGNNIVFQVAAVAGFCAININAAIGWVGGYIGNNTIVYAGTGSGANYGVCLTTQSGQSADDMVVENNSCSTASGGGTGSACVFFNNTAGVTTNGSGNVIRTNQCTGINICIARTDAQNLQNYYENNAGFSITSLFGAGGSTNDVIIQTIGINGAGITFANLPTAGNGSQIYISDAVCTTPATSGGSGCLLVRMNGVWTGSVLTNQTNVFGAFLQNFSSSTMKIPQAAGFTASVNSTIGLDTTANAVHFFTNSADSLNVAEAAGITANVIPKSTDATHGLITASLATDNGTTFTYTGTGGVTASAGALSGKSFGTATNCSSSASPAVCASAAAGSVALPTNAVSSSIVVNTTAVTANSQIFVQTDDTLGTKLSVTCNSTVATLVGGLTISARTAGTSFTIANNVAVVTNPLCVSYFIVN